MNELDTLRGLLGDSLGDDVVASLDSVGAQLGLGDAAAAKVADLTTQIEALQAENIALKSANYDLLVQIGANEESDSESESASGDDDDDEGIDEMLSDDESGDK